MRNLELSEELKGLSKAGYSPADPEWWWDWEFHIVPEEIRNLYKNREVHSWKEITCEYCKRTVLKQGKRSQRYCSWYCSAKAISEKKKRLVSGASLTAERYDRS